MLEVGQLLANRSVHVIADVIGIRVLNLLDIVHFVFVNLPMLEHLGLLMHTLCTKFSSAE